MDALEECNRAVTIDPHNVLYRQLRAEVFFDRAQVQDSLRDLFLIPNQSRSAEVWKKGGKACISFRIYDLPLKILFESYYLIIEIILRYCGL